MLTYLVAITLAVRGPDVHSAADSIRRALDLPVVAPVTDLVVQSFTVNGRALGEVLDRVGERLSLMASKRSPGAFAHRKTDEWMMARYLFDEYSGSGPDNWRDCLMREGTLIRAQTSAKANFRVRDLLLALPNTKIAVHWYVAPMRMAASTPAMQPKDFLDLVSEATPTALKHTEKGFELGLDALKYRALIARTWRDLSRSTADLETRRHLELGALVADVLPVELIEKVMKERGGVFEDGIEVALTPQITSGLARYYAAVERRANIFAPEASVERANAKFLENVDRSKPVRAQLIEPGWLGIRFPGKAPGVWYMR